MGRLAAALLFAVVLLVSPLASRADEAAVPKLTRHVTDLTGTLTTEQVAQLDARLVALEKAKGSQVVVLMVPTTQPDDLESYSLKVAEANKVGREGPDDGVLVLLAKMIAVCVSRSAMAWRARCPTLSRRGSFASTWRPSCVPTIITAASTRR